MTPWAGLRPIRSSSTETSSTRCTSRATASIVAVPFRLFRRPAYSERTSALVMVLMARCPIPSDRYRRPRDSYLAAVVGRTSAVAR
jgi:hypothetical protein